MFVNENTIMQSLNLELHNARMVCFWLRCYCTDVPLSCKGLETLFALLNFQRDFTAQFNLRWE